MATGEDNGKLDFKLFALGSLASNAVNMILVIFVVVWVYQGGGFGASATHPHAVMMVIAMILYGSVANTAFRFAVSCRLKIVKYCHAGMHCIILVLAIVALWIKYADKTKLKKDHFLSLHSWYGLLVICLYILQISGGALAFLLPQTPWPVRLAAKPYHKALGVVIFNLAGVTSITGILITITYGLLGRLKTPSKRNGYSVRSVEIVTFMIPVLIAISCTITTYLILETSFRRQPPIVFQSAITPEELPNEEDEIAVEATSGELKESKENLGNKVEESKNA